MIRILPVVALVAVGWACAGGSEIPAEEDPGTEGAGGDAGSGGDAGASGSGTAGSGTGGTSTGGSGGQGTGGAAGFPTTGGSGGATGGSGGATGGSGGGNPNGKDFGATCTAATECKSGKCEDVGPTGKPNKVCVEPCKTGTPCPKDAHCTVSFATPVCVPNNNDQCGVCKLDTDCKTKGDRCLDGPKKEKFCAQDCGFDGGCPTGTECKAVPGGMAGDKACVPVGGGSCPCAPNRDGDERECTKMGSGLTCTGKEKCDAKTMMYAGCTATTPAPESCNSLDDDCNGKVDDIPGATCNCNGSGSCQILCQPGFSHYPTTLPDSAGCPCKQDKDEPLGGKCGEAVSLGSITDSGGMAEAKISGTLSADDDVDWYTISIADGAQAGTNSYHVQITFESNPGNEFVFVALRGGDCAKETGAPTLTSYDWCVNYKDGQKGEAPCGKDTDGINPCADHTATYAIAVKRNPMAAMKTCQPYALKINAAAGKCDTATIDACGGN